MENKIIVAPEVAENEEVTPQQQCQLDHAGQCGDCAEDGTFTPCPGE